MELDMTMYLQCINPVTIVFCLGFGLLVKRWEPLKNIPNDAIPTVITALAAAANCLFAWNISLEIAIAGAVCGLSSVGVHQIGKISIKTLKTDNDDNDGNDCDDSDCNDCNDDSGIT